MDSLLTVPFFAGLTLAVLLPLVGNLLRLRDEWLATLGLAHLAAAGALLRLPTLLVKGDFAVVDVHAATPIV